MTTNKIRITVAALAAALSIGAVGGSVAQDASAAFKSRGITSSPQVAVTTTTNVAASIKEAGGAGIEGYSDKKCESLLNDLNNAGAVLVQEYKAGTPNSSRANQADAIAGHARQQLEENCLLVY